MICQGWPSCPQHATPTDHPMTLTSDGVATVLGYAEVPVCPSCRFSHPTGIYHTEFSHTNRCTTGACHE
jgi:hypothetical protein